MFDFSAVSKTAFITLKCRAYETKNPNNSFEDSKAIDLYERVRDVLNDDFLTDLEKHATSKILSQYAAFRAREYDRVTKQFLKDNKDGLVINLGAGFDTRFWRTGIDANQYIELDLPEVIAAKKELISDIPYKTIPCSITSYRWISELAEIQTSNILFLAEGVLMYFHKSEIIELFKNLTETFSNSEILFEVINEKYTTGFRKKMVEIKMKRALGSDAGTAFNFGLLRSEDVEKLADNVKYLSDWSFFDDDELRPKVLRLFRWFKFIQRSQWSVRARIG